MSHDKATVFIRECVLEVLQQEVSFFSPFCFFLHPTALTCLRHLINSSWICSIYTSDCNLKRSSGVTGVRSKWILSFATLPFDTCTFSLGGLDYFSTVEAAADERRVQSTTNLHLCFDFNTLSVQCTNCGWLFMAFNGSSVLDASVDYSTVMRTLENVFSV